MLIDVPYNAKTYEFINSIIWVGDDGIVYSNPKPERYIEPTRAQMEDDMKRFRAITGNKKVCMISVAHPKARSPKPEDRDFIAKQLEDVTRALAIVTTNAVNRMVANLFFLFKPAPYPMKMFSNLEDARKWLLSEKIQCKTASLEA